MSKLSWPEKSLNNFRTEAASIWDLHHWKVRRKAVKIFPQRAIKVPGKYSFEKPIQKSMGVKKTQQYSFLAQNAL